MLTARAYEYEGMDLVQCMSALQEQPGRALSCFDRENSCTSCGSSADESLTSNGYVVCSSCIDIDSILFD